MVFINHFWYFTVSAPAEVVDATTVGGAAVAVVDATDVNDTASQTVEAAQFDPRYDLSQPVGLLICHKTSTSP